MSVNKYHAHILVLPDDDANRQIANGFLLDPFIDLRRIDVREEAGGWNEVIERFCSVYAAEMVRFPKRLMVLVIDLDGRLDRIEDATKRIPEDLRDRVFIVGALNEPEDLRKDLGSYEQIGLCIARDCREGANSIWTHKMLSHNEPEINRLCERARSFLFQM